MPDEPKKLLFFAGDAPFLVSHRLNLVTGAVREGYEVSVASPGDTEAIETIRSAGAKWIEWKVNRGGTSPVSECASFLRAFSIVREARPDVVHAVGLKCILHAGIATRLLAIPLVGAVSGLGYLYTGARTWKKRILRRAIDLILHLWLNRRDVSLIFQNGDDAELVDLAGLNKVSVHLIGGSGVDLNRITMHPHPVGAETRIGLPARLLRDKGVYEFVEAARELKARRRNVALLLIGDPDMANPTSVTPKEIDAWLDQGIVEWHPHTRNIAEALARLHIVALPSYREGFPKTLIDAAAAGRAAVTSDVSGCRDAIVEGETGLLCAPKDGIALADALERLILDRDACISMGRAARAHAERHFDVEEVTRRHLDLYRERIASARGA